MGVIARASFARALPLDDDDEEEEEDKELVRSEQADGAVLKVNQAFAERLAHNKKREALHRLQELKKRGVVESSDDDDEDDESSDDGLLPARTDARIFETLTKIKQKDPSIYSSESKFFDDKDDEDEDESEKLVQPSSHGSKPHKPVYLKDVIARQIIEEGSDLGGEDFKSKKKRIVTYADEQQSYKDEFLHSAGLDDEHDEGSGFLTLRRKVQPEVTDDVPELAAHDKDISHRLEEYFGKDDNLDENDRFLKNYLLKKSWVDEDLDRIPMYEEIVGEVMEDEEELEKQDRFEADYNFRFEEGGSSQVMGHSRIVEDSVRRKDDSRKKKREKKKDRLSEAAFERREELKHLKNLKKKEILEKLKKIQTVAGTKESHESLLQVEDLEEEFDPEEYDRKMREAFGEEYYGAEDADEHFQAYDTDDSDKPNFEKEDELLGLPKGWDEDGVGGSKRGFFAARQRAKELNPVGVELDEENEDKDPESDGLESDQEKKEGESIGTHGNDESLSSQSMSKRKKRARIPLREKLAFDKQLEEYYKLDYEDMVGDLPTRFKYRQVKPSMYGLTTSEILAADDKDLNQYVSLKKIAPYVTQEWKPKWRFQASQKMRKKKALKQRLTERPREKEDLRGTARLDDGGDSKGSNAVEVPGQYVSAAEGSKRKRKRRKKGLSLSESRLIAYGKISLPSRKQKRG